MDKSIKTVNINIRVSEEMKVSLVKLADKERRALSDFIRLELEKLVEAGKKK